jgi:hypothetical protein
MGLDQGPAKQLVITKVVFGSKGRESRTRQYKVTFGSKGCESKSLSTSRSPSLGSLVRLRPTFQIVKRSLGSRVECVNLGVSGAWIPVRASTSIRDL